MKINGIKYRVIPEWNTKALFQTPFFDKINYRGSGFALVIGPVIIHFWAIHSY